MPTAANAGYYAGIVSERAILRRLVDAGTRIVQLGYDGQGDATDIVNNAQAEIYSITGSETAEDYVPLQIAVDAALEEIEAASGRDGSMTGVPTGFKELDERPARRSDDRRRRPTRHGKVDPRARLRARRVDR